MRIAFELTDKRQWLSSCYGSTRKCPSWTEADNLGGAANSTRWCDWSRLLGMCPGGDFLSPVPFCPASCHDVSVFTSPHPSDVMCCLSSGWQTRKRADHGMKSLNPWPKQITPSVASGIRHSDKKSRVTHLPKGGGPQESGRLTSRGKVELLSDCWRQHTGSGSGAHWSSEWTCTTGFVGF